MSGKTVSSAILLLVIGNALALVSDVFVKLLEPGAPVFQFAFLRCLITLLLLLPLWKQVNPRRLFQGGKVHFIRAHVHLGGMFCMVIALGALPLATANAIFYAAPIMVMVLSVLVFGERLRPLSVLAVVSGFAGILVILRPADFNWGAVAALGSAAALAINAVMVRKLPKRQSTVHKLALTYVMILPASAILMVVEGAPLDPAILASALGSSLFILGYNITVLLAYRQVEANQVTSAEYTGLVWAVVIGWMFFGEAPDLWFFVGTAMIVVPLILIGLQQRQKSPLKPAVLANDGKRPESAGCEASGQA
ncbi:DMT family transporter [Marinobacter zhejiangensis]|uniref:Permease of the drug/metabolite transporter (DMT) superfamily n=1 Tax=Marinobacter zhejiangensis TaxID=488535 RepID=A0A1I4LH84_9GAMM|nr:DMT family transporter [Marinobacter zhejiangensis]SFL90458.1 Permease of the drug/metabolite transporter (DMT) superfamily [Marinobacter zhejiangensis]